jgi:hypothetical protein
MIMMMMMTTMMMLMVVVVLFNEETQEVDHSLQPMPTQRKRSLQPSADAEKVAADCDAAKRSLQPITGCKKRSLQPIPTQKKEIIAADADAEKNRCNEMPTQKKEIVDH